MTKRVFFGIPTNQERAQYAHMLQRCLEHLLSTTNQPFCVIVNYTIQLISGYSPKGALAIKKNVLEVLGILGTVFGEYLDISKKILDLFFGEILKEFWATFRELCSQDYFGFFFPFPLPVRNLRSGFTLSPENKTEELLAA